MISEKASLSKAERDRLDAVKEAVRAALRDPQACMSIEVCDQGPCWCADQVAHAAIAAMTLHDGWRPIETAPKDGTDILVWWSRSNLMDIACYVDEADEEGWHWSVYGGCVSTPCYWRPLPDPPQHIADHQQETGK